MYNTSECCICATTCSSYCINKYSTMPSDSKNPIFKKKIAKRKIIGLIKWLNKEGEITMENKAPEQQFDDKFFKKYHGVLERDKNRVRLSRAYQIEKEGWLACHAEMEKEIDRLKNVVKNELENISMLKSQLADERISMTTHKETILELESQLAFSEEKNREKDHVIFNLEEKGKEADGVNTNFEKVIDNYSENMWISIIKSKNDIGKNGG